MEFKIYHFTLFQEIYGTKEGFLLEGEKTWSEVSPLPGRSRESLSDVLQQLKAVQNGYQGPLFPSVEFGLFGLKAPRISEAPVCLFLNGSVQDILVQAKKNHGCTAAKLKIGKFDLPTALFLVKILKNTYRLRLDVGGAWSKNQLTDFLAHFTPQDFEFIEDPGFDISPFPMASDDQSLGSNLVSDCKNPCTYLCPDLPAGHSAEHAGIFEQAVKCERAAPQDKDGSKMHTDFCNQTLVWKPMVKGLPEKKAAVVLSSSYESSIGIHQIAALAQELEIPSHPLGIGTFLHLQNDLLQDPPFIREGKIYFPEEFHIKKEMVTQC